MVDNKLALIEYLTLNSKTESWDMLGKRFSMSGETARQTWLQHNMNTHGIRSIVDTSVEDTKHESIVANQELIDAQAYIADLEDAVQKLAEQNNSPAARMVRHFNPGPNPVDYSLEMQKEMILAEMRKNSPANWAVCSGTTKPIFSKRDNLLELCAFDLHIGKLAWDKETGEDYDSSIAVKRYTDAIAELISRVDMTTVDRILLPIGNDMLNVDGKTGMTTAGTPQSCDSRFGKMFRLAKDLMIDTINELSKFLVPIDVVIIPGNHDELTMFTLGEVLDAWFYNNQNVTVYNDPKLRKYYQYGQNLLMFTHGDKEKHSDLGMIMATEEPQLWANTRFREAHLGHLHKSKVMNYLGVDEYQGFKVRILPSLSGTDAWHAGKGYMSQKSAQAFVWNKEKGLVSNHFYNLT